MRNFAYLLLGIAAETIVSNWSKNCILQRSIRLICLSSLALVPIVSVSAQEAEKNKEVTLGFDGLSDLSSNVNDLGVTFTGATVLRCGASLNCPQFPPYSGSNVIYDAVGGVITATFDSKTTGNVKKVSARVTGNRNVTMTAFDKDGVVVGTAQTGGANFVGSSTGLPSNILLSIDLKDSKNSIAKVTFRDSGNTYTIDDFSFNGKKLVIVIDPGHGQIQGRDGKLYYQRPPSPTDSAREDNFTLDISKAALGNEELNQNLVYLTRYGATAPYAPVGCGENNDNPYDSCPDDVRMRREFAEKIEADLLVSVHTNGNFLPTKDGAKTYYCDTVKKSDILATKIQNQITALGLDNEGTIKDCSLYLIQSKEFPSALAEVGYHSNTFKFFGPSDQDRLNDPSFRASAGSGIAKAIVEFINENLK
jgi:N-acetylmuramoyl-L-alanine amidase